MFPGFGDPVVLAGRTAVGHFPFAAEQALAFQRAQDRVNGALLDGYRVHFRFFVTGADKFADLVAVERLLGLPEDAEQGQRDGAGAEFLAEFFMGFYYVYQFPPPCLACARVKFDIVFSGAYAVLSTSMKLILYQSEDYVKGEKG